MTVDSFASPLNRPQILLHSTHSLTFTPHATCFIPGTTKFVVAGQSPRGETALNVFRFNNAQCEVQSSYDSFSEITGGVKCMNMCSGIGLAMGGMKGALSVVNAETLKSVFSVETAHTGVVHSVDVIGGHGQPGAPEIVSGGQDGRVKVWDIRQSSAPVADIGSSVSNEEAHPNAKRECWAVAFGNSFNDDERCVCAGYDNGDVKLFDLRVMKPLWETNIKNGVCGIQFDRKDIKMNKMVVTGLEATFRVFDLRTRHPKEGYASLQQKAPNATTIWTVRHLPQNRDLFVTSSGSGALNLYKYSYPSQRSVAHPQDKQPMGVVGSIELLNHAIFGDQPIASFDWSVDKLGLCVMTGYDQTARVGMVTRLNQF